MGSVLEVMENCVCNSVHSEECRYERGDKGCSLA
jgi:hypothetical protein